MQETANIIKEPFEVDARLVEFGVTSTEIRSIADVAIAARNDSVPHDPSNAAGWLAYCYATRRLRDIYCAQKWQLDRTDGVESVINPETGIKIVYQNSSNAGDVTQEPRSISPKGEASKHLVNSVNGDLFRGWPDEKPEQNQSVWYLFVNADEDNVGIELSRPRAIESGQFRAFSERIILAAPGDDNDWMSQPLTDDDFEDQDFTVDVTRK